MAEDTQKFIVPLVGKMSSDISTLEARTNLLEKLSNTFDLAMPQIEGKFAQIAEELQKFQADCVRVVSDIGERIELAGREKNGSISMLHEEMRILDRRISAMEALDLGSIWTWQEDTRSQLYELIGSVKNWIAETRSNAVNIASLAEQGGGKKLPKKPSSWSVN